MRMPPCNQFGKHSIGQPGRNYPSKEETPAVGIRLARERKNIKERPCDFQIFFTTNHETVRLIPVVSP